MNLGHIREIDTLLHEVRFDTPDGKCLSPAVEYNLGLGTLGITKVFALTSQEACLSMKRMNKLLGLCSNVYFLRLQASSRPVQKRSDSSTATQGVSSCL